MDYQPDQLLTPLVGSSPDLLSFHFKVSDIHYKISVAYAQPKLASQEDIKASRRVVESSQLIQQALKVPIWLYELRRCFVVLARSHKCICAFSLEHRLALMRQLQTTSGQGYLCQLLCSVVLAK